MSAPPPGPPTPPLARMALIGVVAGFSSGLFGVGGGIIIVPLLVMVAGMGHKLATGTSLSAILPISAAGLVGYATAGETDWVAAAFLAVGALGGAVVGTRLLTVVSVPHLKLAFSGVMFVTAARMLVDTGEGDGRAALTVAGALALLALGLGAGILAGLLGVGGGIVVVPALTILFGVPVALAKGTSLAVIVPTSVMGTVRNRATGLTALREATVLGAAGVVSAFVASQVSLELDPRVSSVLFAALLAVVALNLAHTGLTSRRAGRARQAGGAGHGGVGHGGTAT